MLYRYKKRIHAEWNHFLRLPVDTRRFFGAALGYNLFDSILFTYAYAFMFAQTDSFIAVATFNVVFYVTLLAGFFVNIALLKVFASKQLFIVSGILQAASLFSIFYLPDISLATIAAVGAVCGLFQGIYWSVRNSVYLSFTNDDNRHYYEGLKTTLSSSGDMVLLALAGWFIAKSETFALLTKLEAYRFVGLFGVAVLIISTWFLRQTAFPPMRISRARIGTMSKQWWLFRGFVLVSAVQFALVISVPETITLHFLGDEGVLGSMQSLFVLLSAMLIYFLGRKAKKQHRFHLLLASALPLMLLSLSLLFSQHVVLIIGYLLVMYLSNQLFWFVYFPIFSRAIEYETTEETKQYPYVLDHEIWINVSRVMTTLVYIALVQFLGDVRGMFIALALGALMQLATALIAKPLLLIQNVRSY